MDPRLNPNLTRPSARIMQDIRSARPHNVTAIEGPNTPAPQKPLTNPPVRPDDTSKPSQILNEVVPATSVNAPKSTLNPTEVVDSIPMRQPQTEVAAATLPPLNSAHLIQMPGSGDVAREPQDDLDKILQAVNSRVKAPIALDPKKPKNYRISKIIRKVGEIKPVGQRQKPVLAMSVVIIVAMTLSTIAILAYRQGNKASTLTAQPGKVGTSYTAGAAIQAAGGTLVRPSDLDDYSQTLQESLNALNDKQDFDAGSLSAQIIGL